MPDSAGNFKGIAVPALPWKEPDGPTDDSAASGGPDLPEREDDLRGVPDRQPVKLSPGVAATYKRVRAPRVAGASVLQQAIRESRPEGASSPASIEWRKPTLAIDFDGVIHAYSKGWQDGSIYDWPVHGTADALRQLRHRFKLVVFTARHDLDAVREWLVEHELFHYFDDITNRKPMAVAYIDDRAVRFESWYQTVTQLEITLAS